MIEIKKEMVPQYSFERFEKKILWKKGCRFLEIYYADSTRIILHLNEEFDGDITPWGYISIAIDNSNGNVSASASARDERWYTVMSAALIETCSQVLSDNIFYFETGSEAAELISKTLIRYLNKIQY